MATLYIGTISYSCTVYSMNIDSCTIWSRPTEPAGAAYQYSRLCTLLTVSIHGVLYDLTCVLLLVCVWITNSRIKLSGLYHCTSRALFRQGRLSFSDYHREFSSFPHWRAGIAWLKILHNGKRYDRMLYTTDMQCSYTASLASPDPWRRARGTMHNWGGGSGGDARL